MSYLTGRNGSFHTNHGFLQEIPYDITAESMSGRPDLSNQSYNTLEILPGEVGYSGPTTITRIPNYNPGSDPGLTPLVGKWDGMSPTFPRPEQQQMAGTNLKLLELLGDLGV